MYFLNESVLIFKQQCVSRYIMIQSLRYLSWYRKIYEDTYRFCMIYSIRMRLLLKNLNILKNSICYMYRIVIVSWDLYRDTYYIVAIPYRFTPTIFGWNFSTMVWGLYSSHEQGIPSTVPPMIFRLHFKFNGNYHYYSLNYEYWFNLKQFL